MNDYKQFKRIFTIVIDSVGCGDAYDAGKYGDFGTNTLKHLSYAIPDFKVPTLEKLGIGKITEMNNVSSDIDNSAIYGRMEEVSVGKDTLTGHWEMMGLKVNTAFPSFTDTGFPEDLIQKIEELSGRKVIGNIAASGTEIIKDLGEEQMKTGALIVYTSSDSVLQIAAHEDIIPIPELYDICEKVRKITLDNPKWSVGRIIARPYVGTNSADFTRTPRRHDYSVNPSGITTLDYLKEAGYDVISVGKIFDIFNGNGLTESNKIVSNHDGMMKTMEIAKRDFTGLCFVNLVDFDALYGHRRDAIGYAKSLMEFDNDLNEFLKLLNDDDLLIITADHGNDPTHTGTDHTRENVPILVYNKNIKPYNLGKLVSFSGIGKTISDNFNVRSTENGEIIKIELNNSESKKEKVMKNDFTVISNTFDERVVLKASEFEGNETNAIVLIIHGMAEHRSRYDDFANYLADNGFKTYTYDQRGHGDTAMNVDMQGYMSDYDNFDAMVEDAKVVLDDIKEKNPNKKVFLLGHSMGSFISQRFIEKYPDELASVILSGTNYTKSLLFKMGKIIAKSVVKKHDRVFKSDTLENLSFGSYNKKFKPNRTDFDWLSVNEENVDKYIADPFCGAKFSCSYYMDLLNGFSEISNNYDKINKDLPIYLFSGQDDPVGNFGKGVIKLKKTYDKLEIKDVTMKLYPGYRHEMLNEVIKEEVYLDVLNWLDSKY